MANMVTMSVTGRGYENYIYSTMKVLKAFQKHVGKELERDVIMKMQT